MHVIFYQHLLNPNTGKFSDLEYGRVDLKDEEVTFSSEELKREILSENPFYGKTLNPKDGAAFLELLPELFRGAYSFAVLEK